MSNSKPNKFAEILLTQKVGENNSILTYSVPDSMNANTGQIVTIPLRNRQTKGIIFNLTNNKPGFKTRDIVSIEKESPHLQTWQIELIKWISDYYVAPLAKTLKLFLPTTLIKRKKELKITAPADNEENQIKFKHVLSENQQSIIDAINKSKNKISLLHGITGSGKTEVYLNFLEPLVKAGKQVLILVPEISLTPQTCRRFEEFFQEQVIAIHSHLTPKQKEEAWYKIHKNNVKIIIGSRSALFAPFQNLAAIIIDEEHDSCYKQDQNPRYNAIDVAKKISELLNIKVIMGSATPSVETYYLAKNGAYDLYELNERANQKNSLLPKTAIVDMREEIKKKNFSIFSEDLAKQMTEKLTNNEQIILFLNRRGAASAVICRECGFTIDCEECQIPMTYHKKFAVEGRMFNAEKLICHHCGLIKTVPVKCPQCSSVYIKYIGLGTQRIEEDCQLMFPFARILRADRDTTQKKGDFENMYNQFRNHQADILIGTQMISIGLHLPKVNLVGVVMSDIGITIPNFRSAEKTFQLITQVAGRAGRGDTPGQVIIQTYLPEHYAIKAAANHDYKAFYNEEISIRKDLNQPPFSKIIKITVKHVSNKKCTDQAMDVFNTLQKLEDPDHSINYYPALIPRLHNKYRWHILITGPNPRALLNQINLPKSAQVDVDPLSTV